MRVYPCSNLTLWLIYRDRLLSTLGARHWISPTLETQPDTRTLDRIVPAEWPYDDPLSAPRADQPYQPHVIPPKQRPHEPGDSYHTPAEFTGRRLDVLA